MATKGTKKRPNVGIDEEKDIFLSSINKRLRNAKKKMDAIDELEKKDKSSLKPEQLDKLKGKAETVEFIKYNEGVKDLYYAAFKTAQEEGKAVPQQETATRKKTEEDKTEEPAPVRTEEPKQQAAAPVEPVRSQEDIEAEKARITKDVLSKVVNLIHFSQLFRDVSSAQEFRQAIGLFGLDSVPDLESFHEFYVKVFTFSESDKFGKVGDKVNESIRELESYITAAEQPALRNKTYKHLQNVVENVSKTSFFRDRNADVAVPKARHTEPSAIGSELRKGHEQQDAPAPVQQPEKTKSPEKAVERSPEKPVQTQAQTQPEGKRDWGTLDDDEEDENEQAREEQAAGDEGEGAEEEKAQTTTDKKKQADDGFVTISGPKKKEKYQDNYKGSGTRPRGGYRGGDRGGYRGGDRGGYRGERREGEGQEGGYRPRPRRDDQGEGEGEQRGGYRGGYRGRGEGRGGYRGEGRGGYRGERREGEGQGERGYRGGNEQRTGGNEAGRAE